MITFYDLANKRSTTWSPNPWKVRYLNLKQLLYCTVYVEFPDIAQVSEEVGIKPVGAKEDGTGLYTCPAIVDATGVTMSDSYKIAEYLDRQYPDTPKAFPPGTEALQAAFYHWFNEQVTIPLALTIVYGTPKLLNEGSMEYFVMTLASYFGKPLDEFMPVGEELVKNWQKLEGGFDTEDGWYGKSSGSFLVGDTVAFSDFSVAGMVHAVKIICGKDSEDWEKFRMMNNRQWARLLKDLEEYSDDTN